MSCELGDGSPIPESPLTKLKEWLTKRYEPDGVGDLSSEGQVVTGHGREKDLIGVQPFYGKRMILGTLAMAIIAAGLGMNPEFINVLPQALALGISSGVALSVIFGLEKRRYL